MKRLSSLSVLLALTAGLLSAQETEWPAELEARVLELVSSKTGVSPEAPVLEWGLYRGEALLPDGPLELLGSGMGGHWVVRVALASGGSASVRVRVGHKVGLPIAARRIERGAVLAPEDIDYTDEVSWGLSPRRVPDVQVGWVVQRLLRPGDALVAPAVQAPLAVHSGGAVELLWTRGAIGVRTQGTATGSAAVGGRVSVRTHTGRKLSGVVVAPGVVNVTSGEPK